MGARRLSIKQIPQQERPREKLMELGEHSLSDAELMAIVLGSGSRNESAVQLSQRILKEAGSIKAIASLSVTELCDTFYGIGPARACQLKAALELSRRFARQFKETRPCFSNSNMVFSYFHGLLQGQDQEEFWMVALDAKNRLIAKFQVSKGTLMGSLVHPREVFRAAIKHSAAGIIVLHNHPSGDPQPSQEDRQVTQKISDAGRLLGIPLLDHVVIGNNCYYSFKDSGIL